MSNENSHAVAITVLRSDVMGCLYREWARWRQFITCAVKHRKVRALSYNFDPTTVNFPDCISTHTSPVCSSQRHHVMDMTQFQSARPLCIPVICPYGSAPPHVGWPAAHLLMYGHPFTYGFTLVCRMDHTRDRASTGTSTTQTCNARVFSLDAPSFASSPEMQQRQR